MYSQAVTHPSTNTTQCCLTSVIRRELVFSTWYGPRQSVSKACPNTIKSPVEHIWRKNHKCQKDKILENALRARAFELALQFSLGWPSITQWRSPPSYIKIRTCVVHFCCSKPLSSKSGPLPALKKKTSARKTKFENALRARAFELALQYSQGWSIITQ